MLLMLTQWLAQDVRGFNVFNYITLRAVLAAITALVISFVAGPRGYSLARGQKNRAGRASGWPADAPRQNRNTDDGRRADPDRHWCHDALVG